MANLRGANDLLHDAFEFLPPIADATCVASDSQQNGKEQHLG